MQQQVRVKKTNSDGTAQVVRIRESACSGDCHKCAGCGAQQQAVVFEAVNAINAKPGDTVTVEAASGPVLAAAALLYMAPIGLFFLGYFLGEQLWNLGALTGSLSFAAGIALTVVYDRVVARKRKTVYTITGYVAENRSIPE